jgi:molybdopterin-guanine dinucleotide biosynthesis protein A
MNNRPAGVVLAGGRSRRMGGTPKTLVRLGGMTLIERVIERISPQVNSLQLSMETKNPDYDFLGVKQVADPEGGSNGPLGGLLSALEHLPNQSDCLLLVPCDAPFLPLDLAERLMQQLVISDLPVCVVRYENELQPTFSVWHRRLIPELRQAVLKDRLGGFKQFLATVKPGTLDWETSRQQPFFNINNLTQLAAAETLLSSEP